MVSILTGLVAGLIATVVMTIAMTTLGDDSPPPTAALWAKYVGDDGPGAYLPQGIALHFLYGIGAGGAFVVLAELGGLDIGPGALTVTLGAALAYGAVLTVIGAAFWMKIVLSMAPEPAQAGTFAVFHAVYAVVLAPVVVYLSEAVDVPELLFAAPIT